MAAQLQRLTQRMQAALDLSDADTSAWHIALVSLLEKADQGPWTVEARLLYDLQQVCIDHERDVYKLDAVEWSETRATLLNVACLVLTACGVAVQAVADWLRKRYAGAGEEKKEKKDGKKGKANTVVLADGVAAFRRAS